MHQRWTMPTPSLTNAEALTAAAPAAAAVRSASELLVEQERLLLIEATRRLSRCLEPARVIREMLQLMSELIGLNRGRVVLPDPQDPSGRSHCIAHAYGLTREEMERGRYRWGEGITGRVMASGTGAIVQDIDAEPGFLFRAVERSTLPVGTVSFIAVPVMGTHGQLGVLAAHRLRARPRPLAHDLTLLGALAAMVGQVLQVNRLVAERTAVLEQENHRLRHALHSTAGAQANPPGIVGSAPPLRQALRQLRRLAPTEFSVLLQGEPGTGKELFARTLHLLGPRPNSPFVKFGAAEMESAQLEAALFGLPPGMAGRPGSRGTAVGRWAQACGGTLFIDAIDALPLAVQQRLLAQLQQHDGDTPELRLVAASSVDLRQLAQAGGFSAELLQQLSLVPVTLPPLRERRGDLPELVRHIVSQLNQQHRRNVTVAPAALAALTEYDWPGNVRQLEELLEQLVLLTPDGELAEVRVQRALADERRRGDAAAASAAAIELPAAAPAVRHYEWVRADELPRLLEAVQRAGGNRARAARELGMTARQLNYRLKQLT